jgi:predicted regulator of Ras-like GTPase activity (Roadblock/LC7/MglB family)
MSTLPQLLEEDIAALDALLRDLLRKTEADTALIIDRGGFLITQQGDFADIDTTTLAALSAASFAATQSIAGLIGEEDFSSVYQQGEKNSIIVINVDEYSLLVIVFPASISVGAVKYYAPVSLKKIALQMKLAHERDPESGFDLSVLNIADTSVLFQKKG